jgi:hypothetical protein
VRRLAALALAAGASLLAAPASADPTPTPSLDPTLPVTVTLTGLQPLAPQPGDTLRLTGSLHNVSSDPVAGLTLHLAASRTKVGSRGEFDRYAETVDGPGPADALDLSASLSVDLPSRDLAAGADEAFTVSVPVDDLQLVEAWQVYELALSVNGLTPLGESTVARLRTFLPWAPLGIPGVGSPTRLAWVWPLVDRPHRESDTTWTDDTLAAELAPGGRLGALVSAGAVAEAQHPPPPPTPTRRHGKHHKHHPAPPPAKPRPTITPVPVTWAVDPMLVDDATHMAAGYQVGSGDRRHAGTGRTAAKTWLASLIAATGKGSVLALPYADPDVVAASRSGLANEVQVATTAGQTLLSRALGGAPLSYSWPPDGLADQRTLDTLFAAGVTTVVLDSQALPIQGGEPSETPGARTTVRSRDGNLNALLSDHTLTQVVEAGTAPGQGPLAVQRLLSELLMIQAELPSDQRSLVIAPDRRWAPETEYAARLLADTGRVPWIEPVSLEQVAQGPAYTKVARPLLSYPASERSRQLRRGYLSGIRSLTRRIDSFSLILPPGDPQPRAFDSGVLRLLSSAWRDDPFAARAHRVALGATISDTMRKVHIASQPGSLVTLTSHSGTVPVTVTNDLDTPVRVVIGFAKDPRLVVKGRLLPQTIAPHRQAPVDVRATAKTSGVFSLTVRLYTPTADHRPYGAPVHLFVRSTAYGATALLITGGATAVLLLTVVLRLARRARAARLGVRDAG